MADHFAHLTRLLHLEADAERRKLRDAAARGFDDDGYALRKLTQIDEDAGLGGRVVRTFARPGRGPLPPIRLGPGSPVVVTQTGTTRPASARGVLVRRTDRALLVAFDRDDQDWPDDATWRLDPSPDEAGRQRQLAALRKAATADGRLKALVAVLSGVTPPADSSLAAAPPSSLNPPQQDAVAFALAAPDVAVIHGPPGTGKTTTVVELIRQAVAAGETVLACAPSNAAVDHLLDGLLASGLEPVRVGHPARVAEHLQDRTLDELVERHPDARQGRKYAREAQALFRKADKWTKVKPQPGEKATLRAEARSLLAAARQAEELAAARILDAARVVCGTLTGLDFALGTRRYDLLVIDEAAQATEPACWVPLVRAGRVVLAGDPCQLPPTVLSPEAAAGGLAVSLMERVLAAYGPAVSRLLTVQYRMHDRIMAFPSAEFYAGRLTADASVAGHTLPGVEPFNFVDTAGADFTEEPEPDTASRLNPKEAELTARHVRRLCDSGVSPDAIGVIAPYSGQVRRLRELLSDLPALEIDSVDAFQGREKEAVVVSLTRSNTDGEIGFLADTRRTNVAMTRARRCLVLVGDSATLAGHPFYARLIGYAEQVGGYKSVWEEEAG